MNYFKEGDLDKFFKNDNISIEEKNKIMLNLFLQISEGIGN
jgi:hypothetical protein